MSFIHNNPTLVNQNEISEVCNSEPSLQTQTNQDDANYFQSLIKDEITAQTHDNPGKAVLNPQIKSLSSDEQLINPSINSDTQNFDQVLNTSLKKHLNLNNINKFENNHNNLDETVTSDHLNTDTHINPSISKKREHHFDSTTLSDLSNTNRETIPLNTTAPVNEIAPVSTSTQALIQQFNSLLKSISNGDLTSPTVSSASSLANQLDTLNKQSTPSKYPPSYFQGQLNTAYSELFSKNNGHPVVAL